jgi:hypothetical protein
VDSRGVSEDGSRIFFDTPTALVPQDINGQRDVYEWENGQVYLVSAGTGSRASFFLDNSASGNNVYFATADNLAAADTDGGYDVYDARVGGFQSTATAPPCSNDCQGAPTAPPTPPTVVTETAFANGNVVSSTEVQSSKGAKPKAKTKTKSRRKRRSRRRTIAGGRRTTSGRAVRGPGRGA